MLMSACATTSAVGRRRAADADRDIDAVERQIEEAILEAQVEPQARVLRHQRGTCGTTRSRPKVTGAVT